MHAKLDPNYYSWNDMSCSAIDANDNLFMTGSFTNCYHGTSPEGIYINKYDPNGNLLWSDTLQYSSAAIWVTALFLTSHNTFMVAGSFGNYGQVNFFGFMLNGSSPNAIGFKAEFDMNGNCLSANTLPYCPLKLILNADNSLSMAGVCHTTITNLNFQSSTGYFIGKFADFSTAYWLQEIPQPSTSCIIESDGNDNIYLSENGYNIVKYTASGNSVFCNTNNNDAAFHFIGNSLYQGRTGSVGYLEKYTSAGTLVWQKNFGPQTFTQKISTYNGHLLLAGSFRNSFQYGNFSMHVDTLGFNNLFLLETDTNGNEIRVLYAPHANLWCGYSVIETKGLYVSGNNIYLAGEIQGPIAFGTDTLYAGCADPNYVFHAKANLPAVTDIGSLDEQVQNGINIFPNPTAGKFTIEASEKISFIEIRNVLGEKVYSFFRPLTYSLIDLTGVPKGIYFVEIGAGSERSCKKIIIE